MKTNISIFLMSCFLLLIALKANSQETHTHDNVHFAEFGVANSIVYFINEKELAYGLHLHLVKNISHSKFGFGLGYERIFDEHKHSTIGLVGSYTPIERLNLSLSPGIAFEGKRTSEARFALHLETAYGFQLGSIHLGPLLELAYDSEGYHFSLGLHVGFGF